MKPRSMATAIILTALMILPQIASAVPVHNFACSKCHVSGLTLTQIASPGAGGTGNVCLSCHDKTITTNTNDGTAAVVNVALVGADASNAFGNNSGATRQTSHNWAASDKNSLAGAEPPTDSRFYTSNGSSHGKVTCSRCHNPHADRANPQLLTTGPGTSDSMCLDCHRTWNQGSAMSNITHPVGVTYNAASLDPQKYRLEPVQVYNSTVMLVDNKIVCRTCHMVHYADSDAKTIDGYANWNNLSAGDGKLLRSWGRVDSANNTPSAIYNSAVMSSALCTTCHIYDTHSGGHATLGCLDCHSSHSPGGNYYMLRPKVEGIYVPKLGTFYNSTTLIYNSMTSPWKAPDGKGYCEGCHNIPLSISQHNVAQAGAAECQACHNHTTDSFTSACNACHGYAPSTATLGGSTGYAVNNKGTADTSDDVTYANVSGGSIYKDESLTPHARHANGSGNYTFDCKECHYQVVDVNTAPHKDDKYQDVLFNGGGTIAWTDGATPAYTTSGNGSCATTYCHSNGGPRSSGAMKYPTTAPVWATGAGDITTCNACHGNSVATMAEADRNNSATHAKHLAKGYTCAACHSQTATGNTTLVTAGGDHVDGQADVFYKNDYSLGAANLGAGSYNNTDGTCGIYCHSNGTTQVTPDWDLPATGACGTCHQYSNAGVATGSGPALGGAHNAHVFDADGPKLACTICHTNNGTGADHVNGAKSYVANMQTSVCNPCHGSTAGVTTGNDREPIWASAASVDCATCHVGVVAQIDYDGAGGNPARTAPAKNSFYTLGHGDPTLTAGSPNCIGCHTLTADHIDGVTDSNMLTGGATANDVYCQTCHTSPAVKSHYATTGASATGNACAICHEPHGDGMGTNTDAMLIVGSGFADRTQRSSYWNSAKTGVCQTCHDAGVVSYYNRTVDPAIAEASHNPGTVCTQCHKHDSVPAFKAGCTDCHGNTVNGNYWPDSNTYGVDNGTAWPNRLGSHDIHITKIAKVKYATATPTVTQKNATCDYCHPGGSHSGDQLAAPADLGGFKNILGAANVRTPTVTQDGGTNVSCSNVDCHYKTATVATDWYTAGSQATCSYCHTVADAPYVAGTLPDAHNKHMNEFANVGRNLVCIDCHASAGTDNAHQNGVIDFTTALAPLETTVTMSSAVTAGSIAGPKYGLSSTASEFSSCASLYCHSSGLAASWVSATVNWASTTVDCTSCHKGAATDTTLTGAHKAHTFSGATTIGRNLTCNECHAATAGGNSTIGDASKHVNKTRELLVPNNGSPQASCAMVYCHSNGNYGATLAYNSATLDWTVADSYNCTTCHGNGVDKAYPTYANTGDGTDNANSHAAHMVGAGATCGSCHEEVSTVGTSINGTTPTKHVNYTVDVYNTATITGGYSGITDTCSSISCHGGNSAVWGDTLGCRDCHGDPLADTDDFSYNNSTFAKVALDEWTYSGHGKSAAANYDVTGRAGAAFDTAAGTGDGCLYCHDETVSHGVANFFRLRQNGKADLNGACLGCHATGSAGVDPDGASTVYASKNSTVKVDKYHGGAKHNGTDRDAGRWCWDCHDPHGDAEVAGLRIQMIQRRPHQNPDANGVPAALATTDVVFTNNTTGAAVGSFAMNAAPFAQGVCNSCHTTTAQYTQTAGAGSHPTSDCTVCHAHSGDTTYDGNAFKGSGCNGCHGNSTVGNYWPDDNAGAVMPTANSSGRHAKHMEILAARVYTEQYNTVLLTNTGKGTADEKQRNLCAFCHNTPGADADHGVLTNLPADVNGMKNLWSPYDADTASYSSNQHGQLGNDTCSSVNCHNNKTTADNTYGWYDAGASACIMCHSNMTTETTHSSHVNAAITYGRSITCADCHDAATSWATNTKPASGHINGSFVVAGNVTFTYDGTYPSAKGSCGTNDCHNNGRDGAPATATYTWGSVTNNGCSFCHLHNTNNHNTHLGSGSDVGGIFTNSFFTLAGGAGCNACHTHSGNNATHIDRAITIAGGMTYSSSAASLQVNGTAAPGTCTTTICHNNGTNNGSGTAVVTPLWNRSSSTADNCTICHGKGTAKGVPATGSHAKHVDLEVTDGVLASYTSQPWTTTADKYKFKCTTCHGSDLANHLTGSVNVVAGNWTALVGGDTCGTNDCHNDGTAAKGAPALNPATWGTAFSGDTCAKCHGNSPSTNAHGVHVVGIHSADIYTGTTGLAAAGTAQASAHGNSTTSTTLNCNTCHSQTVTNNANDNNAACASCHNGTASGTLRGAPTLNKAMHLDSNKRVVFAMSGFKSKAQLRDDITKVTDLNNSWTRTSAYKSVAADHDVAKVQAAPNDPKWASNSCSNIACHNNITATWQAPQNNCMACHTQLPK